MEAMTLCSCVVGDEAGDDGRVVMMDGCTRDISDNDGDE